MKTEILKVLDDYGKSELKLKSLQLILMNNMMQLTRQLPIEIRMGGYELMDKFFEQFNEKTE